jgi:hypothetical protein
MKLNRNHPFMFTLFKQSISLRILVISREVTFNKKAYKATQVFNQTFMTSILKKIFRRNLALLKNQALLKNH